MTFTPPEINLMPLLPALIPAVTALLIMLADALLPGKNKSWLAWVGLLGLAVAAYFTFVQFGTDGTAFNRSIVASNFALGVSLVILVAAFVTILRVITREKLA